MPVTYKVWIEIERCDPDKNLYENVAEPQAGAVAEFADLDEAIRFAECLQGTGESISNSYDTAQGDDR